MSIKRDDQTGLAYTGRAAAGMIDLIRKEFFQKEETVLFLHTGGQPALFADKYANKILSATLAVGQ